MDLAGLNSIFSLSLSNFLLGKHVGMVLNLLGSRSFLKALMKLLKYTKRLKKKITLCSSNILPLLKSAHPFNYLFMK